MGVGGYLTTKAERDNYLHLRTETQRRVEQSCGMAIQHDVLNIFGPYGLTLEDSKRIVECVECANETKIESKEDRGLVSFILHFGHQVEIISTWRLYASAFTIGVSYLIGGLIPMVPHLLLKLMGDPIFLCSGCHEGTLHIDWDNRICVTLIWDDKGVFNRLKKEVVGYHDFSIRDPCSRGLGRRSVVWNRARHEPEL